MMKLLAVNYHYIREDKPGKGIYPLSTEELMRQVDVISKYFEFVSQEDIIEGRIFTKKQDCCLLTFDDGLKEQIAAFDLLMSHGIPAVFYIATDAIEYSKVLDVHKIHHVRSMCDDEDMWNQLVDEFNLLDASFDVSVLQRQYRYDESIARKVKYALNFLLTAEQRMQFINHMFLELVGCEAAFSKKLYMKRGDLCKLSDAGALGSHSASHRPLGVLPNDEVVDDVARSLRFIESVTGRSVHSISYPYGGPTAVPHNHYSDFESLGLKFGLTMERGINEMNSNDSIFRLKRMDTNDVMGGKHYQKDAFNL